MWWNASIGKKLTLHKERKRRGRVAEHRRERFHPTAPNQVWSMDFVADQLADGSRFRSLTIVDIYTRESLAIDSEQRLKGEDVPSLSGLPFTHKTPLDLRR